MEPTGSPRREAAPRRPTARPRTLAAHCLNVLAVHLDYVEDLGPCVTPEQYAALVGAPRCRAA
eukprot:CAMPEP_0119282450 /NCGR_PEP_ID=MMETSP1329-20130426/26751_1 /TAXON_ID=114041 /ORGANISM="Genus nov. species nov., Strain RCC1024" /LENGTH=62 /DNA_ID=CAMNT_0007283107 /DNA_START=250 /DNA_END=435 /DNA_ORIENTATION=+